MSTTTQIPQDISQLTIYRNRRKCFYFSNLTASRMLIATLINCTDTQRASFLRHNEKSLRARNFIFGCDLRYCLLTVANAFTTINGMYVRNVRLRKIIHARPEDWTSTNFRPTGNWFVSGRFSSELLRFRPL